MFFKDFYLMFIMVKILYFLSRNLPAKPAEEAQKHRQQYEEMVVQAKKRGNAVRMCCVCRPPRDAVSSWRFSLYLFGALEPELGECLNIVKFIIFHQKRMFLLSVVPGSFLQGGNTSNLPKKRDHLGQKC